MAHVPRLYMPGVRAPGLVTLDGEQAKRLGAVMRLREGDAFSVFGGDGTEWGATVASAGRGRVTAHLGDLERQEGQPLVALEVAIAVVRPNRMDWAIEKCTEAGADVIRPVTTEHTTRGQAQSRRDRWQRLAVEAVEQCGRLYVPEIMETAPLDSVVERAHGAIIFGELGGMPWAEAARLLPAQGRLLALVGPEGDFSPAEMAAIRARGGIGVSLGAHILRTETAAVVLTAMLRLMAT